MTLFTDKPCFPKEVFFLGAGASASGGVPTFSNFLEKANIVSGAISENEGKTLVRDVLNHWKTYFNDYNIEEYFSVIEMKEQFGDKDSITAEKIADFVGLVIDNTRKKLNTASYKSLVNYGVTKAFITTNWDFLLERSATELMGTMFNDDAFINYDGIIRPHYKIIRPPLSNGFIPPILKLHGSLNWGYCKDCGDIYYFNKPIYKFLQSSIVQCKIHKDVNLTSFIVPPTLSKLKQTTEKSPYVQLASVWSKAYDYLKLCEKIYFIGYSFPETDVQMKYFISSALRENNNLKRITIVSSPKYGKVRVDFEERYSSILLHTKNNPEVIFDYSGFEKFCESYKKRIESESTIVT